MALDGVSSDIWGSESGSVWEEYNRRKAAGGDVGYRIGAPGSTNPDPMNETAAPTETNPDGKQTGPDYVPGVTFVDGTYHPQEELSQTAQGRHILSMAIDSASGRRRNFWDAILDVQWSDLPFLGMIASVGGSFRDAKLASDTIDLIDSGDRGKIDSEDGQRGVWALQQYMMENDRRSKGSFGSHVGDIVRAAPGFMAEFMATSFATGAARTALARKIAEGGVKNADSLATYGVNRGAWNLAREASDEIVESTARGIAGTGVSGDAMAKAVAGFGKETVDDMVGKVAKTLRPFVETTLSGPAREGMTRAGRFFADMSSLGLKDDALIDAVAENMARRTVGAAIAKKGASTAFGRWATGAGQAIGREVTSAAIDFGTWGSETSTMLYGAQNRWTSALGETLSALFVEAPIKGALMYIPKRAAQAGVSALAGGAVTDAELGLRIDAWQMHDEKLKNQAWWIAEGQNLMEYVSENSGRAFGAFFRGVGLATGLAKTAERAWVGEVGGILRKDAEKEAGGFLRRLIRKSLGGSDQYVARTAEDRAKAFTAYFKANKIDVPEQTVRTMARMNALPAGASKQVADAVGGDFGEFTKRALKAAYADEETKMFYRSFVNYTIADTMARNGWGPDQALNAFTQMGYHGVLGEMFEERYGDMAKGLFGLDEKQIPGLMGRVEEAIKSFWPERGWDQILEEAVAFSVPLAVRSSVTVAQRALGEGSDVERARAAGRNFRDLMTGMAVTETGFRQFHEAMSSRRDELAKGVTALETELADTTNAARLAGTGENAPEVQDAANRLASARSRLGNFDDYVRRTLEANDIENTSDAIAEAVAANGLMRFATLPATVEAGSFADKMSVVYSSEQLADKLAAQDAVLADAAFLGRAAWRARQYNTAEDNLPWYRKAAAKAIGIAGAIICAEPALAQANSLQWASVDEGADPRFVNGLSNLYGRIYKETRTRLMNERSAADVDSAEVDEAMRETYEKAAQDFARKTLMLNGVRLFANTEMLSRAAGHLAGQDGYHYDPADGSFHKDGEDAVPFQKYVDDNRERVEALRDDIAKSTLRLLTADDTRMMNDVLGNAVTYMKLRPGDPDADDMAMALAAQLTDFGTTLTERELEQGVPIEALMHQDSKAVPAPLLRDIVRLSKADTGTTDYDAVPDALVEQVARTLRRPVGDPSDKGLAARKKDVVDLVVACSAMVPTGETQVFVKDINVGSSRIYDDCTRNVVFTFNPSAQLWQTSDVARATSDGDALREEGGTVTWRGTREEMLEFARENGLRGTTDADGNLVGGFEPTVHITPARALVTSDHVLALQKLGLAQQALETGRRQTGTAGEYDYSRVDPALRLDDSTKAPLYSLKDANRVRAEERAKAKYYETHKNVSDYNFDGEARTEENEAKWRALRDQYKATWENVLGENGYDTVTENLLRAAGVSTPSMDNETNQALGLGLRQYRIPLNLWAARSRSADVYVSVDYAYGIDPVASVAQATMYNGILRHMRLLQPGSFLRKAICEFWRDMDKVVLDAIYDARTKPEMRAQLQAFHDTVTSAYESPTVGGITEVMSALCLGQLERAKARGRASMRHDAALSYVANTLRGKPSYLGLWGAADILLGGSGLSDLEAFRGSDMKDAPEPRSGVLYVLSKLNDRDMLSEMAKRDAEFKPAGMTWGEFEQAVNRYAASNFKDRVKPMTKSGSSAETFTFSKLRRAMANWLNNGGEVDGFFRDILRAEPFNEGDFGAKFTASLRDSRQRQVGLQNQIVELDRELAELRGQLKAAADQKVVDQLREKVTAAETELETARRMNADLAAENARLVREREMLTDACVKAGKTGEVAINVDEAPLSKGMTPAKASAPGKSAKRAAVRRNVTSAFKRKPDPDAMSVGFVDNENEPVPVFLRLQDNIDGELQLEVAEAVKPTADDLRDKAAAQRIGVNIVRHFVEVNGGEVTEATFRQALVDLTDGVMTDEMISLLWENYRTLDLRDADMTNDSPVRSEQDAGDPEEGEESAESYNDGAKLAAAYDNDVLDALLSLFQYVSTETGRELQAVFDSLRDNIVNLAGRLERGDFKARPKMAATVEILDRLFNARAVVKDGIDSAPDRQALFYSTLDNLLGGKRNPSLQDMFDIAAGELTIDDMIRELMTREETGFTERKLAFFLSYLRSLKLGARKNFMTLACSSTSTRTIGVDADESGELTVTKGAKRTGSVSVRAMTGSFMKFTRMPLKEVEAAARKLRAAASKATVGTRIAERCREVADTLAPVLGADSPFVQVLRSPRLYDSMIRGVIRNADRTILAAVSVDGETGAVPLVDAAARILERYVQNAGKVTDAARLRQIMESVVTVETSCGTDTSSARGAHKSASVSTPWAWVFNAYTAALPVTVARARTLPERNSRAASKVVTCMRDISSVMSMFMDKDISDRTGFAYHAFEVWKTNDQYDGYEAAKAKVSADGRATEAQMRDYFVAHVLPACRQRMIWPDATRMEIMAKNIDRDRSGEEVREACGRYFLKGFLLPARLTDAEKAEAERRGEEVTEQVNNWFVRVYNGDHSSGVIMQIPTSLVGKTIGKPVAEMVNMGGEAHKALSNEVSAKWLGLGAFGKDSKRSVLSCNEFPGVSMRGVRLGADGTVEKGDNRVHVLYNYAPEMKGHADAFVGMELCVGYGLNVQQEMAKDDQSLTHKLQVMGSSGVDLTLFKGLITMMHDYTASVAKAKEAGVGKRGARGGFPAGSPERVLMDHLLKWNRKQGDLSTDILVDEDSVKVGVLNSKTMFHPTGTYDRNGKEVTETLFQYVFRRLGEADVKGEVAGAKLDEMLADGEDGKFAWRTQSGDSRVKIGDLLGELMPDGTRDGGKIAVDVVDGLSGKTLDFSYVDNTMMSYNVANVSHLSEPKIGRMARNNAVDGLTFAAGAMRSGLMDRNAAQRFMDALSAWGVMTTVVGTDRSNFDAALDNESCMRLRDYGAHRDSDLVREQASRDTLSQLSKGLNPPLFKDDAPLLSGGAVYDDATGTVVSHCKDPFIRNRQQGSRVFSYDDARKYKTARRLASIRMNLPLSSGARYGWFVNLDRLADVYRDVTGSDPAVRRPADGIDQRIKMIEDIVETVHRADRAHLEAYFRYLRGEEEDPLSESSYENAKERAFKLRCAALRLFRDHHGVQLAEAVEAAPGTAVTYGEDYVRNVSFDDLLVDRNDGTHGFDRSAVELDVPDPAGGNSPSVYLGGTVIGLPRTPSYNGSMWAQTCRLAIPVTEIENEDGTFSPGRDAMVMPDPQTLKILGCDHDGDKAQCYMLCPMEGVGTCATLDNPSDLLPDELRGNGDDLAGSAYDWVRDGEKRTAYIRRLVQEMYVDDPAVEEDPETKEKVSYGYRLNDYAKTVMSNALVSGMFAMSRALDCGVKEGDPEKDFYRTPMARATRAQPFDITALGKNDPRWDELKEKSLKAFNFLEKGGISVVEIASKVSTSAGLADRARGQIVSLAGMLHLAKFSGCFDDSVFKWSSGRDNFVKWVGFMYGFDGISNATFDDIKEQICLRLGWTPGMMDSLLVDLITSGAEPPSDSDGFFRIISDYVEDISSYGQRFWMMVASEPSEMQDKIDEAKGVPSTRQIHADIRGLFVKKEGASLRKGVMSTLHVTEDSFHHLGCNIPQISDPALRAFVTALHELVTVKNAPVAGASESKAPAWSLAVSRLVNEITAKRGFSPAAGLVYWARNAILKKEVTPEEAARRYLSWSNGMHVVQEMKDFAKSFNYTKADPASGSMMASRERMAQTFTKIVGAKKPDVARTLVSMFVANMCAYNSPCITMQGLAGLSAMQRESVLAGWARKARTVPAGPLHDYLARAFAERGVQTYKTMQLEGNVQTVKPLVACLTSMPAVSTGTDLMSGNGGLDAWNAMETISRAVRNSEDPRVTTLAFHNGVACLFSAMYELFSTSEQSTLIPAFSYLEVLDDFSLSGKKRSRGYEDADHMIRIACKYRDKDTDTQTSMWAAVQDVLDWGGPHGFAGIARTTSNEFVKGYHAKSFDLSVENLEAYKAELGDMSKQPGRVRRIDTAIRILKALQGDSKEPVRITPEAMFKQFIPLYAVSTERTITPSPKTRSVLNVVPGAFKRISDQQVLLDNGILGDAGAPVGQRLMDLAVSTDLSLPLLKGAVSATRAHIAVRGSLAERKPGEHAAVQERLLKELAEVQPDVYGNVKTFEGTGVEQFVERLNGPEGTVRENPDGTHYVGFLDGEQMLRSLHELYVQNARGMAKKDPADEARPEPAQPVGEEHTDETVKAMADRFALKLAGAADVVYEGGQMFTIRFNGMRGSAAKMFSPGRQTDAVIRVRVGQETGVPVDLNSPAFATSFCNEFNAAIRRGDPTFASADNLTPEEFMRLTYDERRDLVERYTTLEQREKGVTDWSLRLPSWSVDAKGVATLAGEISLGKTATDRKLYHEYFHSMIGMFRTLGVFGTEDVKAFVRRFGKPAEGAGELFNEEAAADAFAEWVEGKTETDVKVQGVFKRFLSWLRDLLSAAFGFKYGFGYEGNVDDFLFGMVLDGYAAQSGSRLTERGVAQRSENAASDLVTRLDFTDNLRRSVDRETDFAAYMTGDATAASAERADATRAQYPDPMEGHEIQEGQETAYSRALREELRRTEWEGAERKPAVRKMAVLGIVRNLVRLRQGEEVPAFSEFSEDVRLSLDLGDEGSLLAAVGDETLDAMTRARARLALKRIAAAKREAAEPEAPETPTPVAPETSATEEGGDTPASVEPPPPPGVSALLEKVKAVVAEIKDTGVNGVAEVASPKTQEQSHLRAAAHLAQQKMSAEDKEIISSDRYVGNVYDRIVAQIAAKEAADGGRTHVFKRGKAAMAKRVAESAAKMLSRATGYDYDQQPVYNVLLRMYEDGYVTDSAYRTNRTATRAIWGVGRGGKSVTHAKTYGSTADFAGALLAASGSRFGSLIETCVKRLEKLRGYAPGKANQDTLDHLLSELRLLEARVDITSVLENPKAWYNAVDMFSQNVFTGFRRGEYDESTGDYGPYVRSTDDSELAEENAARYQLSDPSDPGNQFRQMVLRMAADAAFTTAAQLKFCQEMGYQQGTVQHDAFTGKVLPAHEFTTVTRFFGIGENQLMSDNPLLARWNSPAFTMANVDEWYSSTIRESFGNRPLREMMLQQTKRFRGNIAAMMREINLVSMEWGLNRAEGRRLLALQKFRRTHTMDGHGFIRYTEDGGESWGFSNDKGAVGAVTDIVFTEDDVRDVSLVHTLAYHYMNDDDGIVTGVDNVRFSPSDFMKPVRDPATGKVSRVPERLFDESDLSPENLRKRYEDLQKDIDPTSAEAREMTSLEFALWRLPLQWHSSVTGVTDPYADGQQKVPSANCGLYSRFARTALRLARETFDRYGDDLSGLKAATKVNANDAFNDIILRGLEAEGLVVACAENDRLVDASGHPLLTTAAIRIDAKDIERMWDASEAKAKLVRAGRDEKRLTARHLADQFGKTVVEFKKTAREMPWITNGDARWLNSVDSMLEVYEGTGSYMYHARRLERDRRKEQVIRIGRHEATWQNMLNDPNVQLKTYRNLTDMQLRMIHDYFGTDEEGRMLLDAFERGDYAKGKRKSQRTGLVVDPGSEENLKGSALTDVITQIYHRQLERRLSMLEGTRPADFENEDAIGRMLQAYEHASETGITVGRPHGMNASQLFRMHGVLPANFTVGHALITYARGIQNSLHYRSTLTSLLMTPDVDGDPLYFAKPSLHNWEASGIPDAVWGDLARWWADRLGPSVKYDIGQTGVENARRIYDLMADARALSKSKKDVQLGGGKRTRRYVDLARDEMETTQSMEAFCAQVANPDDAEANGISRWGSSKGIFSLDGSEALGYARHLFQSSRMPPNAVAATYHRILCWSKSMSVAYSFFFPLATKWESPTAAVGALATLGSNLSPDWVRKNGGAVQKALSLGKKEGWIDENFLGFKDIRRMMDTNDPFLADLVMWAESIGITMTDRLVNPMEPGKAAVVEDIETMSRAIAKAFGKKAGDNFASVMDSVFVRQGEKAFTYALNATKLAVAAQVALKLKHEAELAGKAFDPIRDMKGYAEYVDSEVGGVNVFRYAWAHPHMQRILQCMWFSWQWTRTAWEAGGGGYFEDILFGGHTMSKQQRKITPARWIRMYAMVMVGFPAMVQFLGWCIANAFGFADDDDKAFSWDNDTKVGATRANITPFLRLMSKFDDATGGRLRLLKNEGRPLTTALGAAYGAFRGAKNGGGVAGAVAGALPGAVLGAAVPSLVPMYHSRNAMNQNMNDQYFAGIGKQGAEFWRWFSDPVSQAMSKQSLPNQWLLNAIFGYNLANPDFPEYPDGTTFAGRWLSVGPGSAWAKALKMFMPFSTNGMVNYGPTGFFSLGAAVQKGSSQASLIRRAEARLRQVANNDRSLYKAGVANRKGKRSALELRFMRDIKRDADAAGIMDFETQVVGPAAQNVVGTYTREFFEAMPATVGGEFDIDRAAEAMRKLKRTGSQIDDILSSLKKRYANKGHKWGTAASDRRFERRIERIVKALYYNAGGIRGLERENQFRERRRRDY